VTDLAHGMPRKIGRYRIVGRIGRGAMGVVYSAVDELMDRPVALKVLIADLETDPDTRARFYREAQAAARLLHPNVITIYNAGEEQGRSYIAMQLLEGAPLPTYMKRPEAASLERKLDLMTQVCEGLAAAHAEGIIHRDLKPNNLFVQTDGLLKILDFGVARITDSSMTAVGTMIGTPDYMSPEQARGTTVDVRSDIFSAGAVFYFMLVGRKPFPGPDLPAILRQLQTEEPAPLRGIPPELATLVAQAMAKHPDHRPARVEQLLADLVRFRRQYHADTRRTALSLRTEFEEVQSLAASLAEAEQRLGIASDDGGALAAIIRDHPFLARSGNELIPFERAAVNGVADLLRERRDTLSERLERCYRLAARLDEGERLLVGRNTAAATEAFESVLGESPDSVRARNLLDRAHRLDDEQRQLSQHVQQLLAEARAAAAAGEIAIAQRKCRDARALDPRDQVLASLESELEQAFVQEQRRLTQQFQQSLDRAAEAIGRADFGGADGALSDAAKVKPDAPALAAARHRLAQARAAAEAAHQLRELSAHSIRRARATFRRGRYEEGIQQLESFLDLEPSANSVADELQLLQTLYANIVAERQTATNRASELLRAAAAARDDGAYDEAQRALGDVLRVDPTSIEAAEMLDEVLTRALDAHVSREREHMREVRLEMATALAATAEAAQARGYPDVALKAALAAQRLAAEAPGLSDLIDGVRRELTSEDDELVPLEHAPLPVVDVPPPDPDETPSDGVLEWAKHFLRTGLRIRRT
jgi:serine/threonine protein kinase